MLFAIVVVISLVPIVFALAAQMWEGTVRSTPDGAILVRNLFGRWEWFAREGTTLTLMRLPGYTRYGYVRYEVRAGNQTLCSVNANSEQEARCHPRVSALFDVFA